MADSSMVELPAGEVLGGVKFGGETPETRDAAARAIIEAANMTVYRFDAAAAKPVLTTLTVAECASCGAQVMAVVALANTPCPRCQTLFGERVMQVPAVFTATHLLMDMKRKLTGGECWGPAADKRAAGG